MWLRVTTDYPPFVTLTIMLQHFAIAAAIQTILVPCVSLNSLQNQRYDL